MKGKIAILTSDLVRARQTAEILAAELDGTAVEVLSELAPGGSQRRLIHHLANGKSGECVALVGHEPDLGKLAGTLVLGASASIPLKKAGACSITVLGPVEPGMGRLDWLLPPRLLRRTARAPKRIGK